MPEQEEEIIVTRSEKETEEVGFALARSLPPGSVVTLEGDLGTGKTVFARGFARGLGISEVVSSPTYTIVQEYNLPVSGRLYHLDLYRISGAPAALAFGVDEFLNDPASYALLEWPERISGIIPPGAHHVFLRHRQENEREIRIVR